MTQTAKELRLEAAGLLQSISQKEQDIQDVRRLAGHMAEGQVIKDEAGREWTKGMLLVTAQLMEDEITPVRARAKELQEHSFTMK